MMDPSKNPQAIEAKAAATETMAGGQQAQQAPVPPETTPAPA